LSIIVRDCIGKVFEKEDGSLRRKRCGV